MSWAEECIDFIKGIKGSVDHLNMRSMQGEMKKMTFNLICAPGQEGPLQKATLPASFLCESTLLSSCGRN